MAAWQNIRQVVGLLATALLGGMMCISSSLAAELGVPSLSAPMQNEKFFDPERVSLTPPAASSPTLFEPQLFFSRGVREEGAGLLEKHVTDTVHGEAGGKLNLLGDVSVSAVAKLPLYTHDKVSSGMTSDVSENREFLQNTGRLSWRSEVGIPLGDKVNLNFFYDSSTMGKMDRPGVDEKEDKFGTRIIFRFK